MDPMFIYRSRKRWLTWFALLCAAAIHAGAIAIAQGKSEKTVVQDFRPQGVDVDVIDEAQASPQEPEMLPQPEQQLSTDEEVFPEEIRTPPIRPRKKTMVAPVRAAVGPVARSPVHFSSIKGLLINAPRPEYPYEARRQAITGSGVVLLTIDPQTGHVLSARMSLTTGSAILDSATLSALQRWRFRPASVAIVQVPITFTLTGASF